MTTEKILNYQIDTLLGEGSVGKVYTATHTQLGRKVAIKVFDKEALTPLIQEKLQQEAHRITQLQHINIITLYDYLETEQNIYFVQEFAQGQSLKAYLALQSAAMTEQKTIYFCSKVIEATAYAHLKGIAHKDLKPSNIIITADASIKITDFGIAQVLKEGKNTIIQPEKIVGQIHYLSPEQVEGKLSDYKADIYTIGVVLWEMLTGKSVEKLYEGLTTTEIYQKILQENLPPVSQFNPNVSPRLQKIIDKATHKDPNQRYSSCEEFRRDLRDELLPQNNPALIKNIPIDKEQAKRRRMIYYAAATVIGIFFLILFLQIFNQGDKKHNQELSNRLNNQTDTNDTDKKETQTNQTETEEEELTEEEKQMDSLKKKRKEFETEIDIIKKERRKDVLKGLIVDAQLEDEKFGELVIQVTISNQRKDITFKNILVNTTYLDAEGKELDPDKKEIASLSPEQTIDFKITKNIQIAKFKAQLQSADFEDKEPPVLLDSLDVKVRKIDKKIEDLKEINDKKKKEKEEKETKK